MHYLNPVLKEGEEAGGDREFTNSNVFSDYLLHKLSNINPARSWYLTSILNKYINKIYEADPTKKKKIILSKVKDGSSYTH